MMELTPNRIAAVLVASAWLVYAGFQNAGAGLVAGTAIYTLLCLFFIWFGNELGVIARSIGTRYEEEPGCFIIGMGWVLLLITPLLIHCAVVRMESHRGLLP